jgi:hypothetical protein
VNLEPDWPFYGYLRNGRPGCVFAQPPRPTAWVSTRFKRYWPTADSGFMFIRRPKARPVKDIPEARREGERLRLRLSAFGDGALPNPVKEQIVALRELRDRGRLSPVEFAERVAVLLGTSDPTAGYGQLAEAE